MYKHMAKKCRKPKKNKESRKCYKCNKVEHIAKSYRFKQPMKIRRNQEEINGSDKKDEEESFVKGSE